MHIKHRPICWDDVIGQEHIIERLKSTNLQGRAILLSGVRGTGKTTLALILANQFTCGIKEAMAHVNCGHTSTVSEMRDYVDDFRRSNIFGSKKAYIFDEPQLLSNKAINEFLIPFENLPKNVMVIMCSSKSENIEPMLLDRMVRFKTKTLDESTSMRFLNNICKKEGIVLSKYIKTQIVTKCDGIPRKILTSIPLVIDAKESDIEYLLELNAIGEEEDVLVLAKMIVGKKPWKEIKGYLTNLLKVKSPDNIRSAIMNIIAYRLTSDFLSNVDVEGKKLVDIFDAFNTSTFLDKAGLIVGVFKAYLIMK